jgi:DNA-directed RNA polymerase subunit M/transcription elongation factor TFIIS
MDKLLQYSTSDTELVCGHCPYEAHLKTKFYERQRTGKGSVRISVSIQAYSRMKSEKKKRISHTSDIVQNACISIYEGSFN